MKSITLDEARQLIREGEVQSHEQRHAHAQDRLRDLVEFARTHSVYFKKAYEGLSSDYQLCDLPVTTKVALMENYEEWVTDPNITLSGLRTYLADTKNVSENYLDRYTALTTSGTTGNPMPMVRDSYRNIIHSTLIEQRLFRGIDPNDMAPFTKRACVIATNGFVSSYSSALRKKEQLGEHADKLEILSLLTPMEQLVEQLNAHDPKILSGYPSVLEVLAKEKHRGTLKIEPKLIASSAEALSPEMFDFLQQTFHCPVLNNYCSTEGGEIAMSCPKGHLHLNEDWILLEPVDDSGQPVKKGEWSSGVLITDLTNYIQPIIRYYVNDCVRFSEHQCECGSNLPVIEISGRMGDSLSFNEKTVVFLVFNSLFRKVQDLVRWQVIQIGENRLEVRFSEKIGADRAVISVVIEEILKKFFLEYGCGTVEIIISNDDFIKTHGGKVPYAIRQI